MSKPWLNHYTKDCPWELSPSSENLLDRLKRTVISYADEIAFDIYQVDITYLQFEQNCLALARSFWNAGLRPGQKIGILLPNCPEYAEAFFAAQYCGAIAVLLPEYLTTQKLQEEISQQQIHILICLDKWAHEELFQGIQLDHLILVSLADDMDVIHALFYHLSIFTHRDILTSEIESGITNYKEFIALGEASEWKKPSLSTDDAVCIIYSHQGEAIQHNHRTLINNLNATSLWFPDIAGHAIALQNFSNIFGLTTGLLFPLLKGMPNHLLPAIDAKEVAKCLHRHSYGFSIASPNLLNQLIEIIREKPKAYKQLVHLLCTESSLELQTKLDLEQMLDCHITEVYGLTEMAGICIANPAKGDRMGSIGIPLPSIEAAVVNPETDDINPPEISGELIIKGSSMALNLDPEKIFDKWFYTGDLAIMDQQGFFRIVKKA